MEGRLPGCFTNGDRTAYAAAEIATLRLELTAAKARIQETGRHNAAETEHFRAICRRALNDVAAGSTRLPWGLCSPGEGLTCMRGAIRA
jgi:hypothetical protein